MNCLCGRRLAEVEVTRRRHVILGRSRRNVCMSGEHEPAACAYDFVDSAFALRLVITGRGVADSTKSPARRAQPVKATRSQIFLPARKSRESFSDARSSAEQLRLGRSASKSSGPCRRGSTASKDDCVLVGSTLPGAAWIAEINVNLRREAEFLVLCHLGTTVPCERPAQFSGQSTYLFR